MKICKSSSELNSNKYNCNYKINYMVLCIRIVGNWNTYEFSDAIREICAGMLKRRVLLREADSAVLFLPNSPYYGG